MVSVNNNDAIRLESKNKSSFAKDLLKLVSGTAFAQGLGIIVMPLLARLFSPESFGTLALYSSITGIAGSIACLRYELSIMLPENDKGSVNQLGVSVLVSLSMSIVMAVLIWFTGEKIIELFKVSSLKQVLWIIPVAVLSRGIFLSLNYWNSRTKKYGRLSISRIISSVTTSGTNLGFGYSGYVSSKVLVGAKFFGQLVATMTLGIQILHDDFKLFKKHLRFQDMLKGMRKYSKFPLYSTWAVFLNTASWQMPAFLLSYFFSPVETGYYSLGFRILSLPMSLIGASISQVFFQRAAEAKIEGTLPVLVESTFQKLLVFAIFPMLTLTFIGKNLYMVVFGHEWAEAGVYTQILSIWTIFWFVSSPLSTLFSVLEKQEYGLKVNIMLLLTRVISLAVGGWLGNARLALLLFSITGVLVYGNLCITISKQAGVMVRKVLKDIIFETVRFIPLGIILLIISKTENNYWGLVAGGMGVALRYLTYFNSNKRIKSIYGKRKTDTV